MIVIPRAWPPGRRPGPFDKRRPLIITAGAQNQFPYLGEFYKSHTFLESPSGERTYFTNLYMPVKYNLFYSMFPMPDNRITPYIFGPFLFRNDSTALSDSELWPALFARTPGATSPEAPIVIAYGRDRQRSDWQILSEFPIKTGYEAYAAQIRSTPASPYEDARGVYIAPTANLGIADKYPTTEWIVYIYSAMYGDPVGPFWANPAPAGEPASLQMVKWVTGVWTKSDYGSDRSTETYSINAVSKEIIPWSEDALRDIPTIPLYPNYDIYERMKGAWW